MDELRILIQFRCRNRRCSIFDKPMAHPVTRTDLREMCKPQSAKKFMCLGCGELFDLTDAEKASTLNMLDEEEAARTAS